MKLFVGNLSFDATDTDLMDLFGTHGEIEDIYIAKDRDSGRPRGFAFVTFSNKKEALDPTVEFFDLILILSDFYY